MKRVMACGLALVALSGCGETKLLARSLPDETRVIDGPSLAVPPDFELRPPREANDYETLLRNQKTAEAQALITGVSATVAGVEAVSGSVPAGDAWLLEQTGKADPTVREQLARDTAVPEETKKQGLFKRWFGKNEDE